MRLRATACAAVEQSRYWDRFISLERQVNP